VVVHSTSLTSRGLTSRGTRQLASDLNLTSVDFLRIRGDYK